MTKHDAKRPIPGSRRFDVLGIGNAVVDVLVHSGDEFLIEERLAKGHMQLVDRERAHKLYSDMESATEMSGGSAANTMVGVASLGGSASFIGTVSDDQFGEVFRHDLRSAGVHYEVPAVQSDEETARSLVVITPDGQRTMSTYLGAASLVSEDQCDEALIAESAVIFVEGYLFDSPWGERMYKHLASIAHKHGSLISLTLSDPFVVNRYRSAIESALDEGVDVLFSNDDELQALFPGVPFEQAVNTLKKLSPFLAVTRGAAGSLVCDHGNVESVPAYGGEAFDTTGAGDMYAAGFLYAFTHGEPIVRCGHFGSAAAAEIIAHIGARPEPQLRAFVDALVNTEQQPLPGV